MSINKENEKRGRRVAMKDFNIQLNYFIVAVQNELEFYRMHVLANKESYEKTTEWTNADWMQDFLTYLENKESK